MKFPRRTVVLGLIVIQSAALVMLIPSVEALFSPSYWKGIARISRVMDLAHNKYLEPEEAGYDRLSIEAARGMLVRLDPYSAYFTAEELSDFSVATDQEYEGIGVEIRAINGDVFIMNVFPGGSAEAAGLAVGDRILAVDDASAEGKPVSWVAERVRGEPGSEVSLKVQSVGASDPLVTSLERRAIDFPSVDRVATLEGGIRYLRLRNFGVRTHDEIAAALEGLDPATVPAILFDLRSCPGGLLRAAEDSLDLFVAPGKELVRTVDRNDQVVDSFRSDEPLRFGGFALYILQDGNSASAAEIFAGSLRLLSGARILGTTSFGKGSVQNVYGFRDGSGVKLTTFHYTLPDGTAVNEVGVEPDVAFEIEEDNLYRAEISRAFAEMDSTAFEAFFEFTKQEDLALRQALEQIRVDLAKTAPE